MQPGQQQQQADKRREFARHFSSTSVPGYQMDDVFDRTSVTTDELSHASSFSQLMVLQQQQQQKRRGLIHHGSSSSTVGPWNPLDDIGNTARAAAYFGTDSLAAVGGSEFHHPAGLLANQYLPHLLHPLSASSSSSSLPLPTAATASRSGLLVHRASSSSSTGWVDPLSASSSLLVPTPASISPVRSLDDTSAGEQQPIQESSRHADSSASSSQSGKGSALNSRFICVVCNKEFGTKGSLKTHNRVHTGERPFACPVPGCGKSFSQHPNCVRHIRLLHGNDGSALASAHASGKKKTAIQPKLVHHSIVPKDLPAQTQPENKRQRTSDPAAMTQLLMGLPPFPPLMHHHHHGLHPPPPPPPLASSSSSSVASPSTSAPFNPYVAAGFPMINRQGAFGPSMYSISPPSFYNQVSTSSSMLPALPTSNNIASSSQHFVNAYQQFAQQQQQQQQQQQANQQQQLPNNGGGGTNGTTE